MSQSNEIDEAIAAIRIPVRGPLLRALRNLEAAARRVDVHFDPADRGAGAGGRWNFGGTRVSAEASTELLILHDCLNDVRHEGGDDW